MIERTGNTYEAICDGCGDGLGAEFDFMDAVDSMKVAGWRQVPPRGAVKDWYHLCPSCAGRCDFE